MADTVATSNVATDDAVATSSTDQGGIDRISELPLDILCEIFHFLYPTAILRLAQTCKVFRRYLMNKNFARASVWVPALEAVEGLPPCPEDVSEPKYTHFVFYLRCEICRSIDVEKLRAICIVTRCICDSCLTEEFKNLKDIGGASDLPWDEEMISFMIPFLVDDKSFGASRGFHVDTYKRLIREFKLVDPKDSDAITALQQQWQYWFESRMKYQDAYINYEQLLRSRCNLERYLRQKRIAKRLGASGWEDEYNSFFHGESHSHSPLAKRQEINNKYIEPNAIDVSDWTPDWKGLEAEIIPILEAEWLYPLWKEHKRMMVDRIRRWFMPAFLAFVFSQPPNTVAVSAKELALMPEWREALLSRPLEGGLTADLIFKAVELIPASCERIKQWKADQLLDLVRKSKAYEGQEVTVDVLALATTIFRCSDCGLSYTHPIGMIHACNYNSHTSLSSEVFEERTISAEDSDSVSCPSTLARRLAQGQEKLITKAFKGERLRSKDWDDLQQTAFDESAHDHMANLLNVLGYDRRTLAADMQKEQVDVEVLCPCYALTTFGNSDAANPLRWAMHWLDAIRHCKAHPTEQPDATPRQWYARLEGPDRELVATLTKERGIQHYRPYFWDLGHKIDNNCHKKDTRGEYLEALRDDGIDHPMGTEAMEAYVDAVGYYIVGNNRARRCMFEFGNSKPDKSEAS